VKSILLSYEKRECYFLKHFKILPGIKGGWGREGVGGGQGGEMTQTMYAHMNK
jgi:hypothetical protein